MRRTKTAPTPPAAITKQHPNGAREIILPFAPIPAARPRVSRWGTYYPKTYKLWMAEAEKSLAALKPENFDGACAVVVVASCPPFKTVTRPFPKGDVDNYGKAALDTITKAKLAWLDDTQVVEATFIKRFVGANEEPHTSIIIEPYKEKKA